LGERKYLYEEQEILTRKEVETMKRISILLSVLIIVIGLSVSAHGALIDMHDGTIYDTDTQLSWLKDAGAGGLKTWSYAKAWAKGLNVAGLTGWRLPAADPACDFTYNCTGSEMGHLYYTELGNTAGGPLTNIGPFTNLQPDSYWSGTEYAPNPNRAWSLYFGTGYQNAGAKDLYYYTWAVRPGARSVAALVPASGLNKLSPTTRTNGR
jgi:hypothetical protein